MRKRGAAGAENANYRHGFAAHGATTPEYRAWAHMKGRCRNPNDKGWKHWGGRGVSVCERWLNSFENFIADMGRRPPGCSLDRIDPNGNYEPSNCRWADHRTQHINRRNVRLTADDAERIRNQYLAGAHPQTLADEYGVVRGSIDHIIANRAWKTGEGSIKVNRYKRKLTDEECMAIGASSGDAKEVAILYSVNVSYVYLLRRQGGHRSAAHTSPARGNR